MSLFFHQAVQIGDDALHRVIPSTVNVALAADQDGLDFAFSYEEVEQTALDARDILNIPRAAELRHDAVEVARRCRCQHDFVFDHAVTINATLLPGHQSQVRELSLVVEARRRGLQ